MPSFVIRSFRRGDRDQLTELVNRHASAVVPGGVASVNAVLAQLEREPGEVIVDPWVEERLALVAEQAGAIVAAALLLRYADRPEVSESYRGAGEIRWLVFQPLVPDGNPYWQDAREAAEALADACLAQLARWQVSHAYADGTLPVPGVYGVPEQWPHVADLYTRAGFVPGHTEMLLLARVGDLPRLGAPPLDGLETVRRVGINGTRLAARASGDPAGYLELDLLGSPERQPRHGGLADIGNLRVDEAHQRRGVATWLLSEAAGWLDLAGVDRLLAYARPEEHALVAFLRRSGFHELTRTQRGWQLSDVDRLAVHRSPRQSGRV